MYFLWNLTHFQHIPHIWQIWPENVEFAEFLPIVDENTLPTLQILTKIELVDEQSFLKILVVNLCKVLKFRWNLWDLREVVFVSTTRLGR